MHERHQLRSAVIAQLVTANTSAGNRVFSSRTPPLRQSELPAISVYTDDEAIDPSSMTTAPRELTRTVQVAVEGWVRLTDAVDDALDELALQIETGMDADVFFNGTAFNSVLESIEVGIKADGDRPMGAIRLVYSVIYHTDLRKAGPTDNFSTANIHYNLSNSQDPRDQAEDLIDES